MVGSSAFCKKGADIQNREYVIVKELGTFSEALEKVFSSLYYPETLPENLVGEFLQSIHSTLEYSEALREKKNRTHWNNIINAGDGRLDKR